MSKVYWDTLAFVFLTCLACSAQQSPDMHFEQASVNGKPANLNHYENFNWEPGSADDYADAIESTLKLYNREKMDNEAEWIDSQIQVMWAKQQSSGIIEGWHGDGNFARTTIMYCLWKTQGLIIHPWREDVTYNELPAEYINLRKNNLKRSSV